MSSIQRKMSGSKSRDGVSPRLLWPSLTTAGVALVFAPAARGANLISWSSTATTNAWATGGNWVGGVAPANDLTSDIALFNQTSYANQPTYPSGGRNVNGIQVGNGVVATAALTITVTSAATLNLGSGGFAIKANAGSVNIGNGTSGTSGFRLGASQSWTHDGGVTFTVGSAGTASTIAGLGATTGVALTLDGGGAGNTTINDIVKDNTTATGGTTALVVSRTSTGRVQLSGVNTYTGGTTIKSGSLYAITSASALGSGTVLLGDTTGSANATLLGGDGLTYSNSITVQAGNNGTLTIGNGANGNTQATFSGGITLNNNLTVSIAGTQSGNLVTLSGVISGAGALTTTGTNTRNIILAQANTFGGGVTMTGSAGLAINNGGSGGVSSSIGTGTLTINGGSLSNTSGSAVTVSTNNLQVWNTDFAFNGPSDLNLGTGAVSLGTAAGATRTLTVANNKLTIGGAISNGTTATGLVKAGAGTLLLNGANTYSGTTSITSGAVLVNLSHSGAGAYTVSGTGTLGGTGSITTASNAGVTVSAGGKLSPGASVGTLTMDLGTGSLDISGATAGANSQSMLFDLGTIAASDKVVLSGTTGLNIGSGPNALEFDDFVFTDGHSVETGDYTLFSAGGGITGTLGTSVTGTINSTIAAEIQISGSSVILHVTAAPEPASLSLMGLGAGAVLGRRRRRR